MKKSVKLSILITVSVVLAFLLFMLAVAVNHSVKLQKEAQLIQKPLGTTVVVNDHNMNVYVSGTGKTTLVFLAGEGTVSPVLDFKTLYSQFGDDYKIAVVERAGYGYSDETRSAPRDIDTILSETRQALSKASVRSPYVLCAHSMAGLEALYWAQQYPSEVKAIIGLDMATPECYPDMKISTAKIKNSVAAINTGFARLSNAWQGDAVKFGTLTDEEKDLYRALYYAKTGTQDMIREAKCVQENAQKVAEGKAVTKSILMFVSNGEGTGLSKEVWQGYATSFSAEKTNITVVTLDCGHNVQNLKYEAIANQTVEFLKTVK